LNIISPEFSFLDFNYIDNDVCDNEQIASLPVCNDLSIKAQFSIESETEIPTTDALYIAIADEDCNVILDNDIEVTPICSNYKFLTIFEDEVVGTDNPYNLCSTINDTPITEQLFASNPFDLITSSDLEFELELSPVGYQLQFYFNSNIYIFEFDSTLPDSEQYRFTQIDNVYFIKVVSSDPMERSSNFLLALNELIDIKEGTTSSLLTGVFTIADVPIGSYLNSYDFIQNISTVTSSTNIGQYFYWNDNKINYYSIGAPTDILYSYEQSLTDSQWYEFKIAYSAIYTDIVGTITFDNGIDAPTVENIAFDSFSGVITVPYVAVATANYTITIELTDVNGHVNGLFLESIKSYETVLYNVTNDISGNIPESQYTRSELIALISEILGFDFDCEFTSCCEVPEIEFEIKLPDDDTIYSFTLTPYWKKGFINFPELPLDDIDVNCFTYVILDNNKGLIACSNLFHKETDCCYITKIEYSNNEDSFGFTYPTGVTNMVSLPFFLHSPSYPTTEKIYKQTNGQYKRLSADIEKEYECETDYFNEAIHDKLITALKHDNIIVTSNRLGIIDQMTQQGDYNLNWNSKIEFTAMAEFKLKKYFNGKNSNCGANC